MPRLACPACDAEVRVDDAAPGATVRCPGCGQKLTVPKAKTARKDDDEGDDKPRKKKKTKSGSPLVLWLSLGGVAAVVLLAGCGVGGWYLFLRKDPAVGADGWAAVKHKGDVFTAAFPGGRPEYTSMFKDPPKLNLPGGKTLKDVLSPIEMWDRDHGGKNYAVQLVTTPSEDARNAPIQGAALDVPLPVSETIEDKKVTVNGCEGRRWVQRSKTHTLVSQSFLIGPKYALRFSVGGDERMNPDDPDVVKFFERGKPNPNAE